MFVGLEIPVGEERSLFTLILEQASQGKITNGTELFVVSTIYIS